MPRVLLVQGPNMEYLGHRQPELYGTTTAAELDALLAREAAALAADLSLPKRPPPLCPPSPASSSSMALIAASGFSTSSSALAAVSSFAKAGFFNARSITCGERSKSCSMRSFWGSSRWRSRIPCWA